MSKVFASAQETKMQREADSVAVLLERYFDTAFSAPGGIKNLRELILALAMRGKLVPQDPNDPPASELLKEIEAEKKRLVKEGKIKFAKPLLDIKNEEIPYELPENWGCVKLGVISEIERGGSPRPIKAFLTDEPNGLNWIKIGDTEKGGKYITSTNEKICKEGLSKTRMVYPEDFLLTNSMSFGRPYISKIEGCIHDGWLRVSPPKILDKDFLYYLLSSSYVKGFFKASAAGAVVLNLNIEKVRELPILIPSIPEQHRIVAKIDQLMARCDELEKLRAEREKMRLMIHTSAIRQLLAVPAERQNDRSAEKQGSNPRTVLPSGQAAQFIARHFGELYTVKENVAELRKAILQLAVMGKLVPQDPNDPPASELMKEIETEIQRSIKERNIKKTKPTLKIASDEVPFQIPKEWQWVRLSSISESIDYGTSQKTCGDSSLVPVYRMGNIVEGQLLADGLKYIPPNIDDLPRLYLKSNDILFNRTNSYELVGKSAIYFGPDNYATFASYLIRIRLFKNQLLPIFFGIAMNAPYFRTTQIEPEIVQQCGQANFNGTKLSLCLVPLPPLPEQHRIVAKVDQLMSLCDAVEKQIAAATAKQTELLDAMMAKI